MSFETIVQHFGYPAIILGSFLEGETILVVGGFAAHRGYLSLPLVMACAFAGSFIGDQIYFFIGRKKGLVYLEKKPAAREKIERFQALLERYNTIIILAFRFLYGLRTVAPFTIGLSSVSAKRFFILNMISALVWAVTVGGLGYFFGHAFEILLDDLKKYEIWVMGAGLMILAIHLVLRYWKNRKKSITREE
ncbi:MAG: DedA family protein [Spirochaetae bacterium HGW-Spirochaetae-1]|jgi:membrane protein DedA with SNARE-associated domain|nr:MAG: DedA family protein [Spirochaetae bacterium HGW-Spirochaetae-1]